MKKAQLRAIGVIVLFVVVVGLWVGERTSAPTPLPTDAPHGAMEASPVLYPWQVLCLEMKEMVVDSTFSYQEGDLNESCSIVGSTYSITINSEKAPAPAPENIGDYAAEGVIGDLCTGIDSLARQNGGQYLTNTNGCYANVYGLGTVTVQATTP